MGPTKTKKSRTISLGPETILALRAHKQRQAELKMRNRTHYTDFGLVFAKEDRDLQRPQDGIGQPIASLADRRFRTLVKKAGVKLIKTHGLRHTCATLLLQAGTPPHVVAARLGHSVMMLRTIYARGRAEAPQHRVRAYER